MSLCKAMPPNNNSDNKLSSSIITNSNNKLSSSIITNSDNNLNNSIKIVEKFNNTTYFSLANILIFGTFLIIGLFYNHKIIPLIKNKILIAICGLLIYIILLNIIIFIK